MSLILFVQQRQSEAHVSHVTAAVYVDAMSVYAAFIATFLKTPAETAHLCHVQYLRELLDNRVIHVVSWFDTRVLVVDRLTKGAVSRDALHEIMNGFMMLRHECKFWESKCCL